MTSEVILHEKAKISQLRIDGKAELQKDGVFCEM